MRRVAISAIGLAALLAMSSVGLAAAADPMPQSEGSAEAYVATTPVLTPAEKVVYDAKVALAASFAMQNSAAGTGTLTASAVQIESIATFPRHQELNYWCGPAAVQVMSNYAWGKGATGNKWTQTKIAPWTGTTVDHKFTDATGEARGANTSLDNSPQASYPYSVYNPTSGADWYSHLQANILWDGATGVARMPQFLNVQPWWQDATGKWIHLVDWATKSTGGHWIVGSGWQNAWGATDTTKVQFNDGSKGLGGADGAFWQKANDVWLLIHNHLNAVVW
jgi:hypothetical protein